MCLSSVYRDRLGDDSLLLTNVQRIERQDGALVLTDIMERQLTVVGEIILADLIGGKVIIAPGDA